MYYYKFVAIFGLILVLLLGACSISNIDSANTGKIHIKLDPKNLPSASKLSSIVKGIKLIPLETNSDCLIESIDDVFVGKENILVSTNGSREELLRFSSSGKFINNIGRKGKGPGEYTVIRGISVFEGQETVYISGRRGKLIGYTFNGGYIKGYPENKNYSESKMLNGISRIIVGNDFYEVKLVNLESRTVKEYLPITRKTKAWNPLFTGDENSGMFFSATGRDSVWQVSGDSLIPKITFDFGTGHISAQEYLSIAVQSLVFPHGKIYISHGALYGSGYYSIGIAREDENNSLNYFKLFIDKDSHETWHFNLDARSDDILFCSSTDFRIVSQSGEWVSVVSAYELIDAVDDIIGNKDFKYSPELISKIQNMKMDDNPVLVLYEFK